MEHILHATDLVMDYSTQQATPNAAHMLALNHVDFGIQAGESIAVMGPSGYGKSTLLHALAGIITPTAGNVMFRGANLARMRRSPLPSRRVDLPCGVVHRASHGLCNCRGIRIHDRRP